MNNSPLHIILADDDESDRTNFIDALADSKIKTVIHTVQDGAELMEYLAGPDAVVPHLLFLDLNMPCKNGLTCLQEIQSMAKLKDVAIAIYSTSSYDKDIEDTFTFGANVYIKKPTDFGTLKQVLDKVLSAANIYKDPPFNITNFIYKV